MADDDVERHRSRNGDVESFRVVQESNLCVESFEGLRPRNDRRYKDDPVFLALPIVAGTDANRAERASSEHGTNQNGLSAISCHDAHVCLRERSLI